jgi:NitT/TauT family transport system permease protein
MLSRFAPASVTVLLLLVVWQGATSIWAIPNWQLPSPLRIVAAMWEWRYVLIHDIAVTLIETLIGFAVAMLVAIPIAALLVSSNLLWRAFYPVLAGVQSVPKNAIAPLLILWFGTGQLSKAIIAFLISFFPIVINAVSGMTLVDADAHDLMKTLRASRWQVFWYFRLPNALPFIFAAAKVSITLALVGAVIGEFVGADSGLGYVILISSSQLHTDVAFVAIVLLAAIGMALFSLVGLVDRLAMPWLTPEPQQHVLV